MIRTNAILNAIHLNLLLSVIGEKEISTKLFILFIMLSYQNPNMALHLWVNELMTYFFMTISPDLLLPFEILIWAFLERFSNI